MVIITLSMRHSSVRASTPGSQEGFQVRAHDFFHPANTGAVKEFVHAEFFPLPIGLESFRLRLGCVGCGNYGAFRVCPAYITI